MNMDRSHSTRASKIYTIVNGVKFIFSVIVLGYFGWYQLSGPLFNWANEAWWHWFLAIFAYSFLFALQLFPLSIAFQSENQLPSKFWTQQLVHLSGIALMVLMLVAFGKSDWDFWRWLIWSIGITLLAILTAGARMLCVVFDVGDQLSRESFSHEWRFNHNDKNRPPALGLAMSGGGIRSAAFNLGVIQALHEQNILPKIDVISAVSGGSYTLSWYLLQPYYAAQANQIDQHHFNISDTFNSMFDTNGKYQAYLSKRPQIVQLDMLAIASITDIVIMQPLRGLSALLGNSSLYNKVGMLKEEYRNRIQIMFQGAPNTGSLFDIANRISFKENFELNSDQCDVTYVSPVRFGDLAKFAEDNNLPFFIFNATILVSHKNRHMLWPTAFEITSDDIGSDVCGFRKWEEMEDWDTDYNDESNNRFLNREKKPNRWIFFANLAPAISGAAIGLSRFNMRKKPLKMKLSTWTPFASNVDLGYLFPREIWKQPGLIYLSDGGHSDNLGAYALIKRQCEIMIIVDAEHEKSISYEFQSYQRLKDRIFEEQDLLLQVNDIDNYLNSSKNSTKPFTPSNAVMLGEICSKSNPSFRTLTAIYIKLSFDRNKLQDYPSIVGQYACKNEKFPHDPTTNQRYTTEQFVAYRELGHHVAKNIKQHLENFSSGSIKQTSTETAH